MGGCCNEFHVMNLYIRGGYSDETITSRGGEKKMNEDYE